MSLRKAWGTTNVNVGRSPPSRAWEPLTNFAQPWLVVYFASLFSQHLSMCRFRAAVVARSCTVSVFDFLAGEAMQATPDRHPPCLGGLQGGGKLKKLVGRMCRAQGGRGRGQSPCRASPSLAQGLGNRKMYAGRSPPSRLGSP